ncbi:MAG: gliding motility-associated C-terminal domain-containing protein, partial [Bacteroidota bacterium]
SASGGSGSNYTWTPGPSTGSSVVVSPLTNTTYTVIGLAATGCTAQATVAVTVSPLPSLTLSASPATICAGGSSTLTALGAPSVTWNPGAIAGTTAIVSPTATTIFTVSASSGAGCPGTETLAVVVNTVPTVIISSTSNTICVGNSATLSASGAANFTWLPGGSTATSIVVNPVSSTVYSLSGTNGGTCSANSQFTLSVVPLPSLTLTASNATICSGFTTALIATGATNYTWDPGTITGSNIVVSPTVTTTYTLTGESNGCSTTSTLLVFVNPLPTVTANANPTIICVGLTTTLTAGGATTYTWLPGLQTGASFTDAPLATQIYSVIGLDANNCPNIAAVTVSVLPSPTVNVAASPTAICFGGSTTLTATGANTYTWLPSASNNSAIVETPTVNATYTVIGDNAGCSQTQTIAITVNALPTITAVSNPTVVCAGSGITLTANGGISYTWAPIGSTLNPATDNPTISTTYTVDGLDANGCSGQGTVNILVNALPTLTLAATPATICPGATSTLNASGAINYTWAPINSTVNPVAVTPSLTTTYTASGEDANGCIGIDSIQVVVVPSPTVLISPLNASVCAGSNVTLTATGATNYTWLPSNGTNSLTVETPTTTSTYTVIGDNGGGCPNSTTVSVFAFSLPTITAVTNPTVVCAGLGVTLTANGGISYTWAPIGSTLNPATDNPTISTTYTVDGQDANGCSGQGTVNILVNALPTLTLAASPATICSGNTSTLTASGAINYTWSPQNTTVNPVPVTPTVTTTYTASGEDANGCIGIDSIQVQVVPVPTVAISPLNLTVCAGSSATLTATGAANYTWLPSGSNNTFIVDNPTVTTTYTLIGDNGGNCPNTQTVDIMVNPLPANVTVACSGTITCATPTVQLFAGSTSSNVGYNWNGPNSYTSSIQNPTLNVQWGDFTVTVTDTITGCSTTATINVPTDGSIPSVTATSSGSITCAVNTVTLIAVNTTTNPGYTWTGPASFTANAQTVTVTSPGTYTVIVEDLSSNCKDTAIVSVGIHTRVEITASISAATCSNGISLNNGQITLSNFGGFDKYDLNAGSSYTGTATFSLGAANIPTNGIVTSNLANPTNTLAYTIRLFDNQGCIKDTTLILNPVDCVPKVLGIAKSIVSVITNTADGTYDVTYNVTLKNTDLAPLNNVSLTENLANTFPFPTAFTVSAGPTVVSLNSSLLANTGFDGLTQTNLIVSAQSTIVPNKTDSVRFTVKVAPNGNFGPFKNVVIGSAKTVFSVTVADTSQTGSKPDPDLDNNPNNNNNPTVVSFTPVRLLGLTKRGYAVSVNNDPRHYKFYYTISVHNLGNDTIRNISITEDLTKAVKSPASYTVLTKQATGALAANVNFDGKTITELLNVPVSKLRPNATDSIQLVLNVFTDTVRVFVNTASVQATWKNIKTGVADTLRDISNNGINPDKDGNYITNEYNDNMPTVIVLDALVYEPMVPNGFSPNGDGNHDLWVLYNIPFGCNVKVEIYNRWGNKVYTNNAYANDWDGTSNVSGTLGKNKLPQGTYYYILNYEGDCSELTPDQNKPKTGFVELRY